MSFTYDKNIGLQTMLPIGEIVSLFSVFDTVNTRCPIESYEVVHED